MKTEYLQELLPELVRFRARTGLPHWILVDEAHYFLDRPDPGRSVDLELGGYTFVTPGPRRRGARAPRRLLPLDR